MRIIVHDYAGHPFQVQLSRGLAARGHDVLHIYCGSTHTPRGDLERRTSDPTGFDIRCISLGGMIPKSSFVRRYFLEAQYARQLIDNCQPFAPDVVLSGNTPSVPQCRLARWCRRHSVRMVSWVQDVYGLAAYRMLRTRRPGVGHLVGKYFIALDKSAFRHSDAIVVITDDFTRILCEWGIDRTRIHVIHNWAPLEDIPERPRDNKWSRSQALSNDLRYVYSGTLSMRHNPALLLELARMLGDRSIGQLVVVSEGRGVEWLARQVAVEKLANVRCLGFQPFGLLPDVFGSADVLVAILEPDAEVFCVPSKVLSYLCAGRSVLLAVPGQNLAAKIVVECGAGLVVEPTDTAGFCAAAGQLAKSPQLRQQFGTAARQYAEANFDIGLICDRFEAILRGKS